jgi:uncharacterized membrane protein YraQ (UPF0718 family)
MIMNHILQIIDYMIQSFLHTWPYLLVTIPIAVAVKMSGMSKYINKAFTAQPIIAIFLATFVGAFSPLCSCSVIPVVAALLIGGVPLAPVMSFWLASPSMDPEIFFLTVSTLGWELAIWRLAATLVMSLGGGFITHFLVQRNFLGEKILRNAQSTQTKSVGELLKQAWQFVVAKLSKSLVPQPEVVSMTISGVAITLSQQLTDESESSGCGCGAEDEPVAASSCETTPGSSCQETQPTFWKRLGKETWDATTMVIKFMLLAWFLGALIRLYVPETWITSSLGVDKSWAIVTAALLGIPVYTSNLAAMPLVGGLLAQGMHPGAALAFLIAGPTTTLPAMSAVWGLVNRKVFALYIGFSLVGAVVLGYVYNFTL